jgi:ketosteroid isomerase-like protein
MHMLVRLMAAVLAVSGCAGGGSRLATSVIAAEAEVRSTELAFANAMADRDFDAFKSHVSSEAIFFNDRSILHGFAEVTAAWKPLFSGLSPPFSWAPDQVEVLRSGDIALSTGPVIVDGKTVARFHSIWRLEAPHVWRIVFDKGEPVCIEVKH